MRRDLLFTAAVAVFGLLGCSQEPAKTTAAAPPESPFRIVATIQELMDSEVDPSADFLWGSVGFVATKKGVEDKAPHNDKEWAAVRHNALTLIEATNLLVMPGRLVAHEGKPLDEEEKGGIEDPKEIQKAIEEKRTAFIGFAHGLNDAGMQMLKAIDAKDLAAMGVAGEKLDAACEACHRTFWYPNAVEPIQTLEPPKP
ncbi:MAG TPA: hypothetical protein VHT51_09855 [Micropepsaceae bacterium]|jgi:hypothetical protein|nr:hypothetical protein [Micropepsaceae bacterium]